jgi:VWFA-related protein
MHAAQRIRERREELGPMRRKCVRNCGSTVIALSLATAMLYAEAPSQTHASRTDPAQPPVRNPSPIRISVDLVQIDAIVTDQRGRHVPDLTAADFEVLQDGRPQALSMVTYVQAGVPLPPPAGSPSTPASSPTLTVRGVQPVPRDQVRRTMAIVVDDLGLSFQSIARVRNVLRQFVDDQMRPGDLVAILRTGAGMGALQQFTTDRRLLHAAVDGVRWNMQARVAPFEAGTGIDTRMDNIEKELATAATLGAIQYVIRGVAQLPGRKSILLLSDGFRLTDADMKYGRILHTLRSIGDSSNRAGVVLYGIDLRGLVATAPTAADGNAINPVGFLAGRERELSGSQDGLKALADETGGLFITNTNDLGGALRRVLDDQQGYYLLGYVPQSSRFSARNPKFHSLTVRVKPNGLRVRSRRGFLGQPESPSNLDTQMDRILAAVTSPFAGSDIRLRLSSFFGQVENAGPVVLSVMHVDARDIGFSEQADGTRVAGLEVLAMTFSENGQVADQHRRRYTVTLTAERYARALEGGFVYTMRVPVKRPGPYQLRIAIRDATSERIGSASHFIDVPDIKRNGLALSGLLIQGAQAANPTDGMLEDLDPNATVAVRRFRRGSRAHYYCSVYNARQAATGHSQMESEVRLFREGVVVFKSGPHLIRHTPGSLDVIASDVLQLSTDIPTGSYILELTVIDRLAKKQNRVTQTIDFEVIE